MEPTTRADNRDEEALVALLRFSQIPPYHQERAASK